MFNVQLRHLKPLLEKEKAEKSSESEISAGKKLFKTSRTASTDTFFTDSIPSDLLTASPPKSARSTIPPGFNARGYLNYLISIDAMLEHSLMIQYLYSAYCISTDFVPEQIKGTEKEKEYKKKQAGWKEVILGIAKEEMGHFVSVQNVLRFLGFPLNFGRQDFPWDSQLQPFPFELERFSFRSIAKYVYAESPVGWFKKENDGQIDEEDKEARKFIKEIYAGDNEKIELGDPVGAIFAEILSMLKDPEIIRQLTFDEATYPYQAKFDEWGRGYKEGQRGRNMISQIENNQFDKRTPDVLVEPISTRYEAIAAMEKIAEQGEATEDTDETPSHFERFLQIFKEMMEFSKDSDFSFTENIVSNPQIGIDTSDEKEPLDNVITNKKTQLWAGLSNLRYHILLSFLTHSFLLDDGLNNGVKPTARGLIINSTFGEMYNMRTLSMILTGLNVKNSTPGDNLPLKAGAPFQLPLNLDLPIGESNKWLAHRDLLEASISLSEEIIESIDGTDEGNTAKKRYLLGLIEADQKLLQSIQHLTEKH